MNMQKPFVVALTGASGVVYGLNVVKRLRELGYSVALTISEPAKLVIREELNFDVGDLKEPNLSGEWFGNSACGSISYYHYQDLTAPIASGSYPIEGMIIAPASTACFSCIANGISETLIERAAECAIKEGRRLVIVPREMPLSALHLEHLLKLARAGVRVVPAMPAFYAGVSQVQDLIDFVVGKVLDQFNVEHMLFRRWTGANVPVEEGG